ncbi:MULTISPECIES: acetyltransferase [unclassified Campylobacter]|uniref:acetyltransferase n=1 Tax=unclassified Campylobacter TaxID=2593542 RepID=UPI003D345E05
MGYENFKHQDLRALKIVENAKKFGVETLQNEALVNQFLKVPKLHLSDGERANIEEIFMNLMQIEQDVQLSK